MASASVNPAILANFGSKWPTKVLITIVKKERASG